MNAGMKMLLVNEARSGNRKGGSRNEAGYENRGEMGYNRSGGENRYEGGRSESRGEGRYEGRYEGGNEGGQYAGRSGGRGEMAGGQMGYDGMEGRMGYESRMEGEVQPVRSGNLIGFETGRQPPSGQHGWQPTVHQRMGMAEPGGDKTTKEMAERWTRAMENEDGTKGPHWTMEQAKQVMAQRGVNCDPVEFFVALNMMYSDYSKVFKKHGVGEKLDFYVDMAKAFLEDKDAGPGKLKKYFEEVVGE